MESVRGSRMFLTLEEVKCLMLFKLPKEHRNLEEVKEMFLFSCFTGLRFSDVINLRWKNILFEDMKIDINMVKTSNDLKLPMIEPAAAILKRLKRFHHPETYVFKRITNQAINRSLKVIIRLAEIEKTITFHCARHTFATNHIEIGTPIYNVKELLGHQSVDDTEIYAKLLQKGLDVSMANLGKVYAA